MSVKNFIKKLRGGGDNTTTNNINYDASANFESNDRVDTSMMVESLSNIVNKAINDVEQNNSAEAEALSAATNNLSIMGLEAKNFILSNFTQIADSNVNMTVTAEQKNVATIMNAMETSIEKQITKESNTSEVINQINRNNEAALQAALDALPPVPNVPKPSASNSINRFLGFGNKTNNNINVDVENNIKKLLEIDDSFEISDNNNVSNELLNSLTGANYAQCKMDAYAANLIALYKINAKGDALITDIKQISTASTNLKCAFNQTNISNISNKIVSQITTTINNFYKAIKDNPDPQKYELLHHLGAAISDKIISAGMEFPNASSLPEASTPFISQEPPNNVQEPPNNVQEPPNNSQESPNNNQQPDNNIIIYVGVGIFIFVILIFLVIFMLNNDDQ
jgi:hypothetical protein